MIIYKIVQQYDSGSEFCESDLSHWVDKSKAQEALIIEQINATENNRLLENGWEYFLSEVGVNE